MVIVTELFCYIRLSTSFVFNEPNVRIFARFFSISISIMNSFTEHRFNEKHYCLVFSTSEKLKIITTQWLLSIKSKLNQKQIDVKKFSHLIYFCGRHLFFLSILIIFLYSMGRIIFFSYLEYPQRISCAQIYLTTLVYYTFLFVPLVTTFSG